MYQIKTFNREYLESKGFEYNSNLSDGETIALSRKSTVYKYQNKNILEVSITIYSNKKTIINVFAQNKEPYSAWYFRRYGKNKVVEEIDNYIKKECKKFGIKYVP